MQFRRSSCNSEVVNKLNVPRNISLSNARLNDEDAYRHVPVIYGRVQKS